MAFIEDEDDLMRIEANSYLSDKYDYMVDDEVLLESLIDSFEDQGFDNMKRTAQALNRAYRVQTTDIVGNDRMFGARVTFVDRFGEPHRALVMEPRVEEMAYDEAYDPNRDEMVDPSSYPLGTVQLIHAGDDDFGDEKFFFDRMDDLVVETSVIPADGPDAQHAYFAGWDYAETYTDDE